MSVYMVDQSLQATFIGELKVYKVTGHLTRTYSGTIEWDVIAQSEEHAKEVFKEKAQFDFQETYDFKESAKCDFHSIEQYGEFKPTLKVGQHVYMLDKDKHFKYEVLDIEYREAASSYFYTLLPSNQKHRESIVSINRFPEIKETRHGICEDIFYTFDDLLAFMKNRM